MADQLFLMLQWCFINFICGATVHVQVTDGVLSRCNKSNAHKLVNDLLSAMYKEVYLATHSLGGKSSKESCKEGLPAEAVEKIIGITDLT